jgi:hypothetical protein
MPHVNMIDSTSFHAGNGDAVFVGDGVAAHVRERRGHHRQIATGHQDRALLEVDVERRLGPLMDDAEVQEQIRDRAIAMTGAALRLVNGLVDRQRAPRNRAEPREQVIEGHVAMDGVQQRRHGDAPELTIGLNGRLLPVCSSIELNTSPLGSTPTCLQHPVMSELLERDAKGEWLRDRLDREQLIAITGFVESSVGCRQAHAEPFGIDVRQLRNVVGELTGPQRQVGRSKRRPRSPAARSPCAASELICDMEPRLRVGIARRSSCPHVAVRVRDGLCGTREIVRAKIDQ